MCRQAFEQNVVEQLKTLPSYILSHFSYILFIVLLRTPLAFWWQVRHRHYKDKLR